MEYNKRIWKTYLPNNLCEQVDLLLDSGNTGYKTRDDFIKDALYNHLKDVSFENTRSSKSIPSQTSDEQSSKYEDLIFLKFINEFKNLKTSNLNKISIDLKSFSLPSLREFPSFFMQYNIAKYLVAINNGENYGEIKSIKNEIVPNAWIIREKAKLKELNYPTLTEHKISTGFPSSKEKKVNSESVIYGFFSDDDDGLSNVQNICLSLSKLINSILLTNVLGSVVATLNKVFLSTALFLYKLKY